MEGTAKGLVGHDVILTMLRKPCYKFERKGKIVKVEAGCIRLKGCSGMDVDIPLDDEYMRVESIRAVVEP